MVKVQHHLLIIATLALLAFGQHSAQAEDAAIQKPPIPSSSAPIFNTDNMPITVGPGMENFGALKGEEREKKFQETREKVKNMTPEQRKEWREKREAWFNTLPHEKQASLKEKRHMRLWSVVREMPEQCQAVVKKCMADNGEDMGEMPERLMDRMRHKNTPPSDK